MQVTIKVPDDVAAAARARGVPVNIYVEQLLANQAADIAAAKPRRTRDEILLWIDSLARFSTKIPPLPKVISRDWIYQDHD
jgi:hypothetical protein